MNFRQLLIVERLFEPVAVAINTTALLCALIRSCNLMPIGADPPSLLYHAAGQFPSPLPAESGSQFLIITLSLSSRHSPNSH